ncbi:hypothetical protein NDU88_007159 [Pleurodeles waltl]|uniref:Uncharacterized protein n=1 Tax=Pleurodeles waltl TaxID=8319 RepID=A0AAV7QJZ7_PLEWA|nr:hypothetical protein NDU88_007159 [Pleurodeles waltl]
MEWGQAVFGEHRLTESRTLSSFCSRACALRRIGGFFHSDRLLNARMPRGCQTQKILSVRPTIARQTFQNRTVYYRYADPTPSARGLRPVPQPEDEQQRRRPAVHGVGGLRRAKTLRQAHGPGPPIHPADWRRGGDSAGGRLPTQETADPGRGGARPTKHRRSDMAEPHGAQRSVAAPPESIGPPLRRRRPSECLVGPDPGVHGPPKTVWPKTVCPAPGGRLGVAHSQTKNVHHRFEKRGTAGGATANKKPRLG